MNKTLTPDNNSEMARCLKDLRKTERISAEEFGNRVGLSQNYITRIENGTIKKPSFETMSLIAQAASKLDVVKNHDINLNQYDTMFAKTVQSFSYVTEMSNSREIQSELITKMEGIESLVSEDGLKFINRHLHHLKLLKNLEEFIVESKRRTNQVTFAEWFKSTSTILLEIPNLVKGLNHYFTSIDINSDKDIEYKSNEFLCTLLNYLTVSSSLPISQDTVDDLLFDESSRPQIPSD